jgi:hypothetical protein
MAKFKNISAGTATLTDENGIPYTFGSDETRSGLSNYFAKYTNMFMSRPILRLVGDLDENGEIPVASSRNENTIVSPGANRPYSYTAQPTDSPNPSVHPVTIVNLDERRKRLVLDVSQEEPDAFRRVNAGFIGFKTPPTLLAIAETDLDVAGLNAVVTVEFDEAAWAKSSGITATEELATGNLAVEFDKNYTIFGKAVTTKAVGGAKGTFWFSVVGDGDVVVVADPANPAGVAVLASAVYDREDNEIALTFTNGLIADTVDVIANYAFIPYTLADVGAALDAIYNTNVDGFYIHPDYSEAYYIRNQNRTYQVLIENFT